MIIGFSKLLIRGFIMEVSATFLILTILTHLINCFLVTFCIKLEYGKGKKYLHSVNHCKSVKFYKTLKLFIVGIKESLQSLELTLTLLMEIWPEVWNINFWCHIVNLMALQICQYWCFMPKTFLTYLNAWFPVKVLC